MEKKLFLLDNVISESQVRWYNSYWGLQPGEIRYKIGKGTGLSQIFKLRQFSWERVHGSVRNHWSYIYE